MLSGSQLRGAELLWVDRLGCYLTVRTDEAVRGLRVPFGAEALDERDVKSKLTMMAQVRIAKLRGTPPRVGVALGQCACRITDRHFSDFSTQVAWEQEKKYVPEIPLAMLTPTTRDPEPSE